LQNSISSNNFTPNGVTIKNADYIAYDLNLLSNAMPDKTLAGKTIEITFDQLPVNNGTQAPTIFSL
jgi:hypothetical protein